MQRLWRGDCTQRLSSLRACEKRHSGSNGIELEKWHRRSQTSLRESYPAPGHLRRRKRSKISGYQETAGISQHHTDEFASWLARRCVARRARNRLGAVRPGRSRSLEAGRGALLRRRIGFSSTRRLGRTYVGGRAVLRDATAV